MVLQQMRLLSLLSRCPMLAKTRVTSGNCCIRWHQTAVKYSYTITAQHQRNTNHIQRRNFFSFLKKKQSPETVRANDGLESHYDLVYTGNSILYVQMAKGGVQAAVATICATLGGAACGLSFIDTSIITEQPLEVAIFTVLNSFIVVGILKLCFWYPLRIYYSELEEKFVVVLLGAHSFATRTLKINPGEVKPKPPSKIASVLPWSPHLYLTPTQTLHLNMELFKLPVYYNMMLGYVVSNKEAT